MKKKTIEEKAAEVILQRPMEVVVGERTYTVAQPSVATLILASEAISYLPQREMDGKHVVEEVLATAKDCRVLGDIAAILILGAKGLKETATCKKKRLWGLLCSKAATVVIDRKAELANYILQELDSVELYKLLIDILRGFNLADFFGLTTFLTGINLTRPTKVETEATASGQ